MQAKKSEAKAIIVLWVILLVSLCVSLALAGLVLVRRLVSLPILESANSVTGIIFGATYVVYGITLAFSLYLASQEANEAREAVEREAASLEGLFEIAERLPQPQHDRIREPAESYARTVVEEEWSSMARGATSQEESPKAATLVDELQRNIVGYEPDASAEQALYARGLTLASDLEEEREIRLLHSRQDSHRLLWYVLLTGGVITISHSLFFGSKVAWLHGLSVAALTTVVVLLLCATYELQSPFTGSVRIEPEAFEDVLDDVQRRQRER